MEDFNPYHDNKIIEEIKLHSSRKIIAERLKDSYQNKIHASMSKYLEIEKLKDFRDRINKGSIVDHLIRAVALSLSEKRRLNATYDDTIYRIYEDVNISYAVNTERGLVTPVIKKADRLAIDDFCRIRKEKISKVMEWKHDISDILGGTFTITNLGNFGVDAISPIINPPQVAILGLSRICKLNISFDHSKPTIKELLPVSITYDHSVIDGVEVAEFAQVLQDNLNSPERLW
jgi:pyruvate dehydrogenase E2 component (dihydrolipoyllysine-residue acetyltransferase)